MTTAPI